MTERRETTERRSENKAVLVDLQDKITAVHNRVYDGLGAELRKEIKEEISSVRNLFFGILIALLLSLVAIIVEGRVSANQVSIENTKNYKAIIDIGSKLQNHIILTSPRDGINDNQ
jgi:hypothetical protein